MGKILKIEALDKMKNNIAGLFKKGIYLLITLVGLFVFLIGLGRYNIGSESFLNGLSFILVGFYLVSMNGLYEGILLAHRNKIPLSGVIKMNIRFFLTELPSILQILTFVSIFSFALKSDIQFILVELLIYALMVTYLGIKHEPFMMADHELWTGSKFNKEVYEKIFQFSELLLVVVIYCIAYIVRQSLMNQ